MNAAQLIEQVGAANGKMARAALISGVDAAIVTEAWRTLAASENGQTYEQRRVRETLYAWIELERKNWIVGLPNGKVGDQIFWSGIPVRIVEVLDTEIVRGGTHSDYIEDETRHVANCRVVLDLEA
ncbi:MAG: hypothetical protein HC828_02060 [Blastochloris sp.]|nr:hypothetical protein [Blastochloris sp.]